MLNYKKKLKDGKEVKIWKSGDAAGVSGRGHSNHGTPTIENLPSKVRQRERKGGEREVPLG